MQLTAREQAAIADRLPGLRAKLEEYGLEVRKTRNDRRNLGVAPEFALLRALLELER